MNKVVYKLMSIIASKRHKKHNVKFEKDFTIISCNCIGGLLYHDYSMKFLSPTINLYIDSPDFVKFVLNLKEYLAYELEDANNKDYPIGILNDIKIHFLHYHSFEEAKKKWNERKERIIYENIFVIMSDRDNYRDELLDEFLKIKYKKVIFSHKKLDIDDCVFVEKDKNKSMVDDLTKYINLSGTKVYEYYFDFDKWLTGNYETKECVR